MNRVVLFIALRQLWDRKLLNGIAVLGVTLGVLVLIAINGIMQGFQVKFLDNILNVYGGGPLTLTDTFFLRRSLPEVPSWLTGLWY